MKKIYFLKGKMSFDSACRTALLAALVIFTAQKSFGQSSEKLPAAPVVIITPADIVTCCEGGIASFTASAAGNPAPAVQWQENRGEGFVNIINGADPGGQDYSGATQGKLVINGVTGAMSGYIYRAVFSNSFGSVIAPPVKLTVGIQSIPTLWSMSIDGGWNGVLTPNDQMFGGIFKVNGDGSGFSQVHSFTPLSMPQGSLLKAADNKLYGMTQLGGTGNGVLFSYDPSTSMYTSLVSFTGVSGAKAGAHPLGSLIQSTTVSNTLYGMTKQGGANDFGVIFSYNYSTNTYTKLFDFSSCSTQGTITDANLGGYPNGDLLQASDGLLYGMTIAGGKYGALNNTFPSTNYGNGVIFRFDPINMIYIRLVDFTGMYGQAIGANPEGSLMEAANGKLYGMTAKGGANSKGVLFSYDPTSPAYTKLLDFDGNVSIYGSDPTGNLIQAAGTTKLYGMTQNGGPSGLNHGVIFTYDYSGAGTYTKVFEFDNASTKGSNPLGSLMQASDGNLYGMNSWGGTSGVEGVIFSFTTGNVFTKLVDFTGDYKEAHSQGTGAAPGGFPYYSNLIEAPFSSPTSVADRNHSCPQCSEITISPNPAKEQFTISGLQFSGTTMLEIYNVFGEKVFSQKLLPIQSGRNSKPEVAVDASAMSGGIYFVQVQNESSRWVGRFIKQ